LEENLREEASRGLATHSLQKITNDRRGQEYHGFKDTAQQQAGKNERPVGQLSFDPGTKTIRDMVYLREWERFEC